MQPKINVIGEREVATITACAEFKACDSDEFGDKDLFMYIAGWLAAKRHAAQVSEPVGIVMTGEPNLWNPTPDQLCEWEARAIAKIAAVAQVAEPVPSGASVDSVARDAARMAHFRAKHVMGASYGSMVTLCVIVRSDDYALGGIDWALDCQRESVAAMSAAKTGGEP